jgi:predicted  nucleic acid-binding Zn-ribbon protein
MSQNQDFLNNFQNSLNRLSNITSVIEQNTQGKQQFSELVFRRLREINDKIRSLGDKIKELKGQLSTLEQQVEQNNMNISNRDANVQRLQSQIERLTVERDELKQQMSDLAQRAQTDAQSLQQRIDQAEAQIRQLTEQNANLTQQIQELNNVAAQRGTEAAAQNQAIQEHATRMEQQRQQHATELEQMKQQNDAQIEQLKQQIEGNDKAMADLQGATASEIQRLNDQIASLTQEKDAAQNQIGELQRQIEDLRAQNDNLIQRIIAATDAINAAMDTLEQMNNPAELQQNLQQANALFEDVETSLANISRAISGRELIDIGQRAEDELRAATDNITDDTMVTIDRQGTTMRYAELKDGLIRKIRQRPSDQNFKYLLALNEIRASSPNEIANILSKYNINTNNGAVVGGKKYKTRKIRKQKGGFVYDTPSSRKKRTSLSKFTRTSKNTTSKNSRSGTMTPPTSSELIRKNKKSRRTTKTSKLSSRSSM